MTDYKLTVVVEKDEDGLYVASVPFLQGYYTQGATYEEALENIKDAIKLHIEARRALGERIADGQQCQYTKVEIWGKAS
ncbi:MAG: type II toxin-antitoxin system HicB family antitoxin [Dehalococcoidia bacterium]